MNLSDPFSKFTYNGITLDGGTTWPVSDVKGWMLPDRNPFPRIRLFGRLPR